MKWAERALRAALPAMARRVVQDSEDVRGSIVDVMRSGDPSGYTDAEGYTSSAPGEPPAYGKGVYADSWKVRPPTVEGHQVHGGALSELRDPHTGQSVARGLEWGDENNLPRPHVRPGIEMAKERIRARVRGT